MQNSHKTQKQQAEELAGVTDTLEQQKAIDIAQALQGDAAPPINPNQAVVDRMFDSKGRSITGVAGPSLNKSFEEAQNQFGQRTSLTPSLDREEYSRQLRNIQSGYNNSIADFLGRPRQPAFTEEVGPATSAPAYDRNAFLETMLGSQWRDKVQRLGAKGTEALFTALDKDRETYYAGQRDPLKDAETRSNIELRTAQARAANQRDPLKDEETRSNIELRTAQARATNQANQRDPLKDAETRSNIELREAQARASDASILNQQRQIELQGELQVEAELAQAAKADAEYGKAGLDALEKKQTRLMDSAEKFLSGNTAFNKTAFAGLLAQSSPDEALTTVLNQFGVNPAFADDVRDIKLRKDDIAKQLKQGKIKREDLGAAYASILRSLYGMRPVQQ